MKQFALSIINNMKASKAKSCFTKYVQYVMSTLYNSINKLLNHQRILEHPHKPQQKLMNGEFNELEILYMISVEVR